jgi:hypothetical protein
MSGMISAIMDFFNSLGPIQQLSVNIGIVSAIALVFISVLNLAIGFYSTWIEVFYKRRSERWNRKQKGEQLIDHIYENEFSHAALRLTDGSLTRIKILPEFCEVTEPVRYRDISFEDISSALTTPIGEDKDVELATTICFCFDNLFYQLDRIESYLEERLVRFQDVERQLRYYIPFLTSKNRLFLTYIEKIEYDRAGKFLKRF